MRASIQQPYEPVEKNKGDFNDYMPNFKDKSMIVSYGEFSTIWKMLPGYVKIRIPQLVFCAGADGFNLNTLYRKLQPFKNEYKFTLVIVQTKNDQVFGCYIDDVFIRNTKSQYIGSGECFVFSLKPSTRAYYDTGINMRYLYTESNYF